MTGDLPQIILACAGLFGFSSMVALVIAGRYSVSYQNRLNEMDDHVKEMGGVGISKPSDTDSI